ncbi:glycosyltransferase [Pannonibacter tanglangensis]|uniref:Glycosyltransferase n=1 Tax=Pannonibacter tanglangensis TaxID=2750084 RepID=A0ABW9ZLX8_9HYPH|nr:glycosyltransferase [Pannonibacter sp. XCT-34]NBN64897.1 glycosyltransferase [Pannonibacter sp. XCT-34]
MRILMACAAFPPNLPGGAQTSSLMLARMLQSQGADITVVNVGDVAGVEDVQGLRVHRIRSPNIYWDYLKRRPNWKKPIWHLLENGNPFAFSAMRRQIRTVRPDLLLTVSIENINVASWAAAKLAGLPVAHTSFNSFLMCWNSVMQRDSENCSRQCSSCRTTSLGKKFFTRYVDGVVGESQDVLNRHMAEGYFPNAVMKRIPAVLPRLHAEAGRRFPAGRPFRVGFLGLHSHFKGIAHLADAAQMMADMPDVEFHIAGEGAERDNFGEEVRRRFPAASTRFYGWVKADDYLREIDVLVYPSIGREAFGRASIEAFAHAVPVISTSIGGVAENITDGVNGYHVPPGDAGAIREAILRMALAPATYERLSAGALAAAHGYLPDTLGREFSSFLETVRARSERRLQRKTEVHPA